MARTEDITADLASVTGKRVAEVALMVRRLREHDYWVRETRSPRSPRPTPLNVAYLLIAMLSGVTAKDAPNAVRDALDTVCEQPDEKRESMIATLETRGIFKNTASVLRKDGHMFVEAVEAIIKDMMEHPGDFDGEAVVVRIQFDRPLYGGVIEIDLPYYRQIVSEGKHPHLVANISLRYINYQRFEQIGLKDYIEYALVSSKSLLAAARKLLVNND